MNENDPIEALRGYYENLNEAPVPPLKEAVCARPALLQFFGALAPLGAGAFLVMAVALLASRSAPGSAPPGYASSLIRQMRMAGLDPNEMLPAKPSPKSHAKGESWSI